MKTHPTYPPRSPFVHKPWEIEDDTYDPVHHIDPCVLANTPPKGRGWADQRDAFRHPLFKHERLNWHCGTESLLVDSVRFDDEGRPLNPAGRTGIADRGLLGLYGPNFCADPIVRRPHPHWWHPYFLFKSQIACCLRLDNGKWALPGGVCDQDDDGAYQAASITCAREFKEEVMGVNHDMEKQVDEMFSLLHGQPIYGKVVYKGKVDDERDTDNAWMVTQAYLFEKNDVTANLKLRTGDPNEVAGARWLTYPCGLSHANHIQLVKIAYELYPYKVPKKRLAKFILLWSCITLAFTPTFWPVVHATIAAHDNPQCMYLNATDFR